MRKYWRTLVIVLFLLFVSCSHKVIEENNKGIKEITEKQGQVSILILGTGDEVIFNVWRHDELKRTVRIDPSGNVYLPLAGEITASGLTIPQLKEEVTLRLSKYIIDPQVDISVSELRSQKVHILGEVRSPGTLALDRKMLIWEGISRAGGFTNDANENQVLLVRGEKDAARVTALNLDIKDMLKDGTFDKDVYLKNGDIVYVPPSFIADVERFMTRFNNIINPFVTIERGIILTPEALDVLRGKEGESIITITP